MLLTIAIPTFNRVEDLNRLLSSIQVELSTIVPDLVEVLVINNASTDSTEELLTGFSSRIAGFRNLRNDINIGMQGNFVRALRESRGEYTWMIGDDEIVEPDGITNIISAIQEFGTPLLVFNYSSEPSPSGICFLNQVNNIPLKTELMDLKSFVFDKGWLWALGNLGMVVVKNTYLHDVDPAPHMRSCFIQAGWYFEALHGHLMAFVNKPVFRTTVRSQTKNKERWNSDGTLESFYFINDSIQHFIKLGIIPKKIPTMFLNSCSCNRSPIWNYFLHPVTQRIANGNFMIIEREWETMTTLISQIDDESLCNTLIANLEAIKRSIAATLACHQNTIWITNKAHPGLYFGTMTPPP